MSNVKIENCQITHFPARVLAEPAQSIEKIDDNTRQLVEKMTEIMLENKGMGLAGPQAGVGLRIFIISMDATAEKVRAYINPTVKPSGSLESSEEGCLSVPGIHTNIKRYQKCSVTATDLDGNEFTEEADGLYARCLQHEYDHLQGVTIANRMSSTAKIIHRRQLKKLIEQMSKD